MKRLILATLLLATPVMAQEQPQQSQIQKAVGNRLMTEINNGIACEANVLALQEKIKELEAKLPKEEKK